jgi:hypothetical protein
MIEPILHSVLIDELRPTQITVGLREVAVKRKEWCDKGGIKGRRLMTAGMRRAGSDQMDGRMTRPVAVQGPSMPLSERYRPGW